MRLGDVRLILGEYVEGLAAYEEARSLRESPTVIVNIGAAHAALGQVDAALMAVERGLATGFESFDALEGSPYFASLDGDPRFRALIDRYRP